MDRAPDRHIVDSWHANAAPWVRAVRQGEIPSRVAVTNDAVLSVIGAARPSRVLDVGCGEGWLCHALARQGVACVGVDVVPALVEAARAGHPAGGAPAVYAPWSYEEIAAGGLRAEYTGAFDLIVSNFALIGDEAVAKLLGALPALLAPGGQLVIQTLHPVMASLDVPYVDGWRAGSWAGFAADFQDPPPWYFRTIGSWVSLLGHCGFTLTRLLEPVYPDSGRPASLILVAQ